MKFARNTTRHVPVMTPKCRVNRSYHRDRSDERIQISNVNTGTAVSRGPQHLLKQKLETFKRSNPPRDQNVGVCWSFVMHMKRGRNFHSGRKFAVTATTGQETSEIDTSFSSPANRKGSNSIFEILRMRKLVESKTRFKSTVTYFTNRNRFV